MRQYSYGCIRGTLLLQEKSLPRTGAFLLSLTQQPPHIRSKFLERDCYEVLPDTSTIRNEAMRGSYWFMSYMKRNGVCAEYRQGIITTYSQQLTYKGDSLNRLCHYPSRISGVLTKDF